MRIIFSLYLLLMSAAVLFAEGEEHAPIWQQGTVMLIQAVSFAVLVYFIYKFLLKPVSEEMETRQKQIEDAYKDAENSKKFCEEKRAEYEQMIKHADEEVQAKLAEAVREGNQLKEAKINEGILEAKRKMEIAEYNIANEKAKAEKELKNQTGSLGVKIASKILKEEIDQAKHERLIDNFIKDLD